MFELVRFLHMLLIILAFANFATITIMQILHITMPTTQFITKFRLQRSVTDAGSKPIKNHLSIGFAFVFNVCEGFVTLIVEG